MPNQTFFNLPDKKRQRITDLAIAEFAAADYENASITNIVKQAKIAKGSFYQYFEDKKDLYLYLVDSASEQRMHYIKEAEQSKKSSDFFETLRWLFRVSSQFSLEHPLLNQIINRAAYGDSPLREEVLEQAKKRSSQYVRDLVEKGIANGDLVPDLDPDLAVFIIMTTGDSLRYFIPEKLEMDTRKLAEQSEIDIDMQAVERIFDDLIRVYRRGMSSTPKRSTLTS